MAPSAHIFGFLAILVSLGVVLMLARAAPDLHAPLVVGWVLRAGYCIYNTYFFTAWVDDFEGNAALLSQYGFNDIWSSFGINSASYTWFCSVIYYAIGRNPVVLQVTNILFWVGTMTNLRRMAGDMDCGRNGKWALWILAIFPTSIVFSVAILRESVCIFLISSGVRYWLSGFSWGKPLDYVSGVGFLIMASVVHYGCVVLLIGLATIPLLQRWTARQRRNRGIAFQAVALLLGAMLIGLLFYGGLFQAVAPSLSGEALTFEEVSGMESGGRELGGRTNYMRGLTASSPLDFTWQAPIRVLFFWFAPLPWMMTKMIDGFAFLDAITFMVMFALIFRSPRILLSEPRLLGVIYFALLGSVVFALGTVNFGTAIRHRGKFLPLFLVASACAWEVQRQRKNARRSIKGAGFVSRPAQTRHPQAFRPSRREV